MSEFDVAADLNLAAGALRGLTDDEDRFRAWYDAFLAGDADSYRRILGKASVLEHEDLLCGWLCSKECVRLCWRLCGPPRVDRIPEPRDLAEVIVKLTSDEELLERLVQPVLELDPRAWQSLIDELELRPFCHLLCHWVCRVYCRLRCDRLDATDGVLSRHLEDELAGAGRALATLLADESGFAEVSKAALAGRCELVKGVFDRLGLADRCRWICEFFCSWRCVRVCITLCRPFQVTEMDLSLTEAYEFAQAVSALADKPEALEAVADAVEREDVERFASLVKELGLERYCVQLCHWVCSWHCTLLCRCVCTPVLQPWFTHIGHFDIYADIDSGTGLTNKGLSFSGLYHNGGPGFAFQDCLELRGYCPVASPIDGTPMRYRFLLAGTSTPITGSRVCQVDAGTRIVSWPQNLSGVAGAANVSTFQTIAIAGAPTAEKAPPAPGDPWYGPDVHTVVPDGDGWVVVDPASIAGGFTTLMGFDTTDDVPGGMPTSANPAGQTASPAPSGQDLGIVFEATRVSGPTSPPDHSNTLTRVHISNWKELNLLDIQQFHGGGSGACSPITSALDVDYTADHELMAAWSVSITSASPSAPGTVAGGNVPRGGFGTDHENTTSWQPCSYTASLSTRAALTTGLIDNQGYTTSKTFCTTGRG